MEWDFIPVCTAEMTPYSLEELPAAVLLARKMEAPSLPLLSQKPWHYSWALFFSLPIFSPSAATLPLWYPKCRNFSLVFLLLLWWGYHHLSSGLWQWLPKWSSFFSPCFPHPFLSQSKGDSLKTKQISWLLCWKLSSSFVSRW